MPRFFWLAGFALCLLTPLAGAQMSAAPSGPGLGLAYVGALGMYGGLVEVQRGARGGEVGGMIDLGSIRSPRIRLTGDASFLFASYSEFVPQEDRRYSGEIFDLSLSVAILALGGSPRGHVVPYASLGAGVHALSSSYQSTILDERYNANRLGLTGAAGVRWWSGRGGRYGGWLEARRTYALDMNRWGIRLGIERHFGQLSR
jgi:hypothetical protein